MSGVDDSHNTFEGVEDETRVLHDHGPSWLEENDWITKVLYVLCAIAFLAGFPFANHGHWWWENYVFFAIYGFCSYVGLVLVATQIRKLIRRDEDYYGE